MKHEVAVFGPFRFDLSSCELTKHGLKLSLEDQPAQVLRILIEHADVVVSREELRNLLWPNGIHVDYEHGVNKSINKVRTVLGDNSAAPRFISTLRGRGYRFIGPVDLCPAVEPGKQHGQAPQNGKRPLEPLMSAWQHKRQVLLALSTLAAAVAVMAGAVLVRHWSSGRALPFDARDWVLVAGFENHTGEPLFDGTLQYALERELSNSRFVNVVPRERVEDVLRLMKRPLDTSIDTVLAREICLRDGGIRALLTGRAEKLGATYVFSARLIEPRHGTVARGAEEQAEGQGKVWPAVGKLSNWARRMLGEELASIEQSDLQLEKVTTPSLRALQLYSEGLRGNPEQFLRQAIVEDPNFAMAHMMLSCVFWNSMGQEDWKPEAQRALQLSSDAPERERLFIQAGYHHHLGNWEKAAETYEALLRLYPDDHLARGNLGNTYMELGRSPEVLLNYGRGHASDYDAVVKAAVYRATIEQDLAGARRYIKQARQIEKPAADAREVKFFPVHEYWLRDDPASGLRELSRIMDSLDQTGQSEYAESAGEFYLSFGRLQTAKAWFQKVTDSIEKPKKLALAAYAGDDQRSEKLYLAAFRSALERGDGPGALGPILQARMGPGVELDQLVLPVRRSEASTHPFVSTTTLLVEGEYALAQGHSTEAISLLRQAADWNRQIGSPWYFAAAESLANALERHAESDKALRVLEQASRDRFRNFPVDYCPYGIFWIRIQARLAQLYHQTGRPEDARKIEDQLGKLLAYADPDYPILKTARHCTNRP